MSRRRSRVGQAERQAVGMLLARAHDGDETDTFGKVREQLLTISDTWPVLAVLLASGSTRGAGGGKPASRAPIDAHVADVRQEVALWVRFLARVLMEEVTVERTVMPPWADAGVHAAPWAPPSQDTGELAHHIATERLGHFLHHEDQHLRIEFMDDAERLAGLARRTAWPSGARWLRTGVDCTEAECQGEYRVFMHPDQDAVGDMVCTNGQDHRITPLEWQRAMRRRPMNAQAAARFAATLRLARVS